MLERTARKVLHKRCLGTPSNHENDGFVYTKPSFSHFHLELQNNRKWCPTGTPADPFGTPWASFWVFGRVLGTGWNFDGFWDPPWVPPWGRGPGWWKVKVFFPGSNYQFPNTSWLTPEQQLDKIQGPYLGNWSQDTAKQHRTTANCRLESVASQPGGPLKGAGGFRAPRSLPAGFIHF